MKKNIAIYSLFLLAVLSLVACSDRGQKEEDSSSGYYIAIEINGDLCGYSRIRLSDSTLGGKNIRILRQNTWLSFKAMGKVINQYQRFTYFINPSTGNFIYHDSYIKQGNLGMGGYMHVENGKVRVTTLEGRQDTVVVLPENVVLPNTQFFPWLADDLGTGELTEQNYTVFDVRTNRITEFTYIRLGEERLDLAGGHYDAVLLSESDPMTGMKTKMWIDKKGGRCLRRESQNHLSMYLTDATVLKKIKTGRWDDMAFIKTNRSVKEFHKLSYMKIKAALEPVPAVSLEDINMPGQRFSGRIDGDLLEGIFEISPDRYDGRNAPSFPPDTGQNSHQGRWLQTEERIESDNPALVAKAEEITEGSGDSWEAACRLGRWVAENINGALEDGTARETFDRRWGNCASQSLLMAALCRAAGIPARVVWGCVYTPEKGGSFGHHAWNEIYMGRAGWIPVDVTLHETDYVNAGHLRLGVLHTRQTVINFREMEILEFRTEE